MCRFVFEVARRSSRRATNLHSELPVLSLSAPWRETLSLPKGAQPGGKNPGSAAAVPQEDTCTKVHATRGKGSIGLGSPWDESCKSFRSWDGNGGGRGSSKARQYRDRGMGWAVTPHSLVFRCLRISGVGFHWGLYLDSSQDCWIATRVEPSYNPFSLVVLANIQAGKKGVGLRRGSGGLGKLVFRT